MSRAQQIAITGGAGFVGSHLADRLLQEGHEVTVYDVADLDSCMNLQEARKQKGFSYIQGDIRDRSRLETLFERRPDKIYHLASIVGVHKYMDDPFGLIDIVVIGTRHVAELALKYNTHVILTSTSEVFGKNPKVPWDEEDDRVLGGTGVDRWSYSSSKAICEHMLRGLSKQKGLPLTVVRYFNAYGPRQSPIFVVSKSVHRVLNNQRPLLFDGGEQTRCFTYIDDAVRGTIMAAESPKGMGEVFNIGNNREVTMREMVELILKHSGSKLDWELFDTKKEYGAVYEDIGRRVPSVEKAKRVLDWQVRVSHEEGIVKTLEWAKQNSWWLK